MQRLQKRTSHHNRIHPFALSQVRAGKWMMSFYGVNCESDHARRKGTWERVAFVYDKNAKTQTIIVDGFVVKKCTDMEPFLGKDTVLLGQWLDGDRKWEGKIKKVQIFNQALSADRINALLQGNTWALLLSLLFLRGGGV